MNKDWIKDIYIILLSLEYHRWGKNNAIQLTNNKIKAHKEIYNDIDE